MQVVEIIYGTCPLECDVPASQRFGALIEPGVSDVFRALFVYRGVTGVSDRDSCWILIGRVAISIVIEYRSNTCLVSRTQFVHKLWIDQRVSLAAYEVVLCDLGVAHVSVHR